MEKIRMIGKVEKVRYKREIRRGRRCGLGCDVLFLTGVRVRVLTTLHLPACLGADEVVEP